MTTPATLFRHQDSLSRGLALFTSREAIFDLGVEFSEVSQARLSITFSESTGVYETVSHALPAPSPLVLVVFPGMRAHLRDPYIFSSASGGVSSSPSGTGPSVTDLFDVEFEFLWKGFDGFLDGSDQIRLSVEGTLCESICHWSREPTATVTAASLTVSGVVVPEPSP